MSVLYLKSLLGGIGLVWIARFVVYFVESVYIIHSAHTKNPGKEMILAGMVFSKNV